MDRAGDSTHTIIKMMREVSMIFLKPMSKTRYRFNQDALIRRRRCNRIPITITTITIIIITHFTIIITIISNNNMATGPRSAALKMRTHMLRKIMMPGHYHPTWTRIMI